MFRSCPFLLGIILLFGLLSYIKLIVTNYSSYQLATGGTIRNVTHKFNYDAVSSAIRSSLSSTISGGKKYEANIDLVSLTVGGDFYVLFNNSAITSWIRHIQNLRTITFVGPPADYGNFTEKMKIHYPNLVDGAKIPIRWVNETHWVNKYMKNVTGMPCPYWKVCQQLFKLHIYEIRTDLGLELLDNVLIVDSDTVWGRDVTFVNETDGRALYFDVDQGGSPSCNGMDAVAFTESITRGLLPNMTENKEAKMPKTLSPYKSCSRPEFPNSTGYRHIPHHMLFQYDIMQSLHTAVTNAWNTSTLWEASNKCFKHKYCQGRVSEYELYFNFVSEQFPERIQTETITQLKDVMLGSAICDEEEMECCREKNVLLKGCHDHRISNWRKNPRDVGDMCCPRRV